LSNIKKNNPILNGLRGLCPHCGVGRLFQSYIKPFAACQNCAENFVPLRADDGPAWLTIFISSHIIVPLIVEAVKRPEIPSLYSTSFILLLAILLIAILLPISKGFFMAMIWRGRQG
jgi:uncharacterized protein (DUF983 family)